MTGYKKRVADALLAEKLSYMGAVLVQGPKWCGKTTTSHHRYALLYGSFDCGGGDGIGSWGLDERLADVWTVL